jgi:GT2 family glycosyltransferase
LYQRLIDSYKKATIVVQLSIYYLRRHGFAVLMRKISDRLKWIFILKKRYEYWIRYNEPDGPELDRQCHALFPCRPKISIVVPVYNTQEEHLRDMIGSVVAQTYPNWELCIADGKSSDERVRNLLSMFASSDDRIKVKYLDSNEGIAGNTNAAISHASGEYVGFLDHDDTLAPFALYEVVSAINRDRTIDVIYSDEDNITGTEGRREGPHFKPDWSPDTLRSFNYIGHFLVIQKALLDDIGGLREGYAGSQDYDLLLRASERSKKIEHIAKVLYHWRMHSESVSGNPFSKTYAYESAKRALSDHLLRQGIPGRIEDGLLLGSYQVQYRREKSPLVSIIIPNCDHVDELKICVSSILERSSYKTYEIVVIENNSVQRPTFEYYELLRKHGNVHILTWTGQFNFAAVNNYGVEHAAGEVLLFLNNDTEVIADDWIDRMLEHAMREGVGAVGAKLYYPNGTIQHAGIIIGMGGTAGHAHLHCPPESFGYFGRPNVIHNVSAVTGACMMIRRSVFQEVGGFDERFALAFNDVDLCLKIRAKGYLIVWTPFAELYHDESRSRGYEITPARRARFNDEIELFREKWKSTLESGDPYYSPNMSLERDFVLKQ